MSVQVITTESACPWQQTKQTHYLNQSRKRSAFPKLPQTKIVQARGPAYLANTNLKRKNQDHLLTSNTSRALIQTKTGNIMKTPISTQLIRCLAQNQKIHLLNQKKATLRTRLEGSHQYQASRISNCEDKPQRYS